MRFSAHSVDYEEHIIYVAKRNVSILICAMNLVEIFNSKFISKYKRRSLEGNAVFFDVSIVFCLVPFYLNSFDFLRHTQSMT